MKAPVTNSRPKVKALPLRESSQGCLVRMPWSVMNRIDGRRKEPSAENDRVPRKRHGIASTLTVSQNFTRRPSIVLPDIT
jgi:hypothetical protein